MKRFYVIIFIFVFAAFISIPFITGCNENGTGGKIAELVKKLAPMGETAANNYLNKLIADGKITEYQKDKIVKLYLKLKAKRLNKSQDVTKNPVNENENDTDSQEEMPAAAVVKD